MDIDEDSWEEVAADRGAWRQVVYMGIISLEAKRAREDIDRRQKRKAKATFTQPPSFKCESCLRDYHSRIGLFSHSKHCQ